MKITVLALVLVSGTATLASAAGFQCQPFLATPQQARQEGITELMGDLATNCTGGNPYGLNIAVGTVDIKVVINTEVTSRLLDTTVNGSEALLLVDEPAPATQHVCLAKDAPCPMLGEGDTSGGVGNGPSPYLPANGNKNKNVFQGKWDSSQPGTIMFTGIPIDPPGTVRQSLILRVTNVRGNASGFNVSGGIGGVPIFMTISASNPSMMPINNPQQIVAFVFSGLAQNQDSPASFTQCAGVNTSQGKLQFQGAAGDFLHNVGFAGFMKAIEGFSSAFKIRNIATTPATPSALSDQNVAGTNYPAVETDFFNSTDFAGTEVASAGLADSGTRIKVEFNSVPAGVHVYVPLKIISGLLEGDLVANEAGPYAPAPASAFDPNGLLGEVALSNGTGVAVYEIVSEDPTNTEELDVPVIIAYLANSPATGTATAGVTLAPNTVPPDFAAENSSISVPRFVDTSAPASRFSINSCAVAAPTISASPNTLPFSFQIDGNLPPGQVISVGSTNPSSGVNFNASLGAGCTWLTLNNTSGITPANVTATAHPTGLAPATYNCPISINAPSASNSPQVVQASLTVTRPAAPPTSPSLTVSPGALVFNASSAGQQPSPQTIALFTSGVSLVFSATATASGGNWLSLNPSSGTTPATLGVTVNPAGLAPGVYYGTIAINCASASPGFESIPVTLNVASTPGPPASTAGPEHFTFSFVAGANQPQSRHVTIAGPVNYHASTDAPWLSVTPADGTASATTPALLSIWADPTGLGLGTYTGTVTVTDPPTGVLLQAFVTMTISESTQSIVLPQTGLSFRAAVTAGGGIALMQPLSILRGGTGMLNWSLTATTLAGGNWLSASTTSGSTGDSASLVNVQVATAGLALGDYYGQLRVDAPGAVNSPQFVDVVLTVSSFDDVTAMVDPIGLLFVGSPSGPSPSAQSVTITNPTGGALSFESSTYSYGGGAWFTTQPPAGSVGPGQTQQITIQPNTTGLQAGTVYQGEVNLSFSDHSTQKVSVLLVASSATASAAGIRKAALSCAPANLIALITSVGGEGSLSVGRPVAVRVQAVDNCGAVPQGNGSLELQFSNGDPAVALTRLPGGTWAGTFTPKSAAPGSLQISVQGELGAAQTVPNSLPYSFTQSLTDPLVLPLGISSAASYSATSPIAPGSLVNIYGHNLADSSGQFTSLPLPVSLSGTQVLLAGKAMPLISVSADRIIAQVPFETGFNTSQQLIVTRGSSQSSPETVPVAPAQPAVFTANQQGTGQAVATVGNTAILADANHPAKAGDVIVIYCAGLGAVTPPVASGAAAPAQPLSRTVTPMVTIGGQPAQVLFSGLAPGYAGLYQVNVVVPAGVAPGDAVPVVLAIGGQTSPPVTIALR